MCFFHICFCWKHVCIVGFHCSVVLIARQANLLVLSNQLTVCRDVEVSKHGGTPNHPSHRTTKYVWNPCFWKSLDSKVTSNYRIYRLIAVGVALYCLLKKWDARVRRASPVVSSRGLSNAFAPKKCWMRRGCPSEGSITNGWVSPN